MDCRLLAEIYYQLHTHLLSAAITHAEHFSRYYAKLSVAVLIRTFYLALQALKHIAYTAMSPTVSARGAPHIRTIVCLQGFAYVGYKTPEAAATALDQLNCIEFPPNSGQRLKARMLRPRIVCVQDSDQRRTCEGPWILRLANVA